MATRWQLTCCLSIARSSRNRLFTRTDSGAARHSCLAHVCAMAVPLQAQRRRRRPMSIFLQPRRHCSLLEIARLLAPHATCAIFRNDRLAWIAPASADELTLHVQSARRPIPQFKSIASLQRSQAWKPASQPASQSASQPASWIVHSSACACVISCSCMSVLSAI